MKYAWCKGLLRGWVLSAILTILVFGALNVEFWLMLESPSAVDTSIVGASGGLATAKAQYLSFKQVQLIIGLTYGLLSIFLVSWIVKNFNRAIAVTGVNRKMTLAMNANESTLARAASALAAMQPVVLALLVGQAATTFLTHYGSGGMTTAEQALTFPDSGVLFISNSQSIPAANKAGFNVTIQLGDAGATQLLLYLTYRTLAAATVTSYSTANSSYTGDQPTDYGNKTYYQLSFYGGVEELLVPKLETSKGTVVEISDSLMLEVSSLALSEPFDSNVMPSSAVILQALDALTAKSPADASVSWAPGPDGTGMLYTSVFGDETSNYTGFAYYASTLSVLDQFGSSREARCTKAVVKDGRDGVSLSPTLCYTVRALQASQIVNASTAETIGLKLGAENVEFSQQAQAILANGGIFNTNGSTGEVYDCLSTQCIFDLLEIFEVEEKMLLTNLLGVDFGVASELYSVYVNAFNDARINGVSEAVAVQYGIAGIVAVRNYTNYTVTMAALGVIIAFICLTGAYSWWSINHNSKPIGNLLWIANILDCHQNALRSECNGIDSFMVKDSTEVWLKLRATEANGGVSHLEITLSSEEPAAGCNITTTAEYLG